MDLKRVVAQNYYFHISKKKVMHFTTKKDVMTYLTPIRTPPTADNPI